MDEAAFRATLTASPTDAATRRVFADWLEERGDPRAAWVRSDDVWRLCGPDFRDPVPALMADLARPVGTERLTRALIAVGAPAVPALVRALAGEDQRVCEAVRAALQAI